MKTIRNHLWVLHRDYSNPDNSNLTLLDLQTLAQSARPLTGFITSDSAPIGADVWVSTSEVNGGKIYRLDAQTGSIQATYTLPDSTYSSWTPVSAGNKLWFTTSVSGLLNAGELSKSMMDFSPDQVINHKVYAFDPVTNSWLGLSYNLPAFAQPPIVDHNLLWYTLFNPLLGAAERPVAPALLSLKGVDGQPAGAWSPCPYVWGIYPARQFTWGGCVDTGVMWALDRQQPAQFRAYSDLGTRPWSPVCLDNQVWFTFRDNNLAAVFDGQRGDLLRVFATGANPEPPVIYRNQVWVYNAGDGTLQKLIFPENVPSQGNHSDDC